MDKKDYDSAIDDICRALVGEMLDAYFEKLLANKENLINQMVAKMSPAAGEALRGTVHIGGEFGGLGPDVVTSDNDYVPWHGKVKPFIKPEPDNFDPKGHPKAHEHWPDYEELISDLMSGKMRVIHNSAGVRYYKPNVHGHDEVSAVQKAMCDWLLTEGIAEVYVNRHMTEHGCAFEFLSKDKHISRIEMMRMFPRVSQGISNAS